MKVLKLFSELSTFRIAIIAVLVTVGYYFLYYDNGEKIDQQIQTVTSQLDVEKAKRVEIDRKMRKEDEMRGNVLQLARNLEVVKAKIPNEFNEIEISSIVNRVSEIAQVKILALKRSLRTASPAPTTTGSELIDEVNFDIEMTGTFNGIINFVELLSKEEKTIKIRNFVLEKPSTNLTEDTTIRFKGEIVGFKQSAKANTTTTAAPGTATPGATPGAPVAPAAGPKK